MDAHHPASQKQLHEKFARPKATAHEGAYVDAITETDEVLPPEGHPQYNS
jgi:hypothetical protein